MTELIWREMYQLFTMFYCGLAVMFLFEVRNKVTDSLRGHKRLSIFVYFLSWLAGGFLFCQYLYRGAHGKLSVYGIVAFAAGLILWKKFIYGIIDTGKTHEKQDKKEKD